MSLYYEDLGYTGPTRDELLEPAWMPVEADEMPLGTRVVIFRINRGTHEQMWRRVDTLARNLRAHVDRKYPLDLWSIGARKSKDPWGGYEIWAEYHGVVTTPQMKGRWKAQRRRERRAKTTP